MLFSGGAEVEDRRTVDNIIKSLVFAFGKKVKRKKKLLLGNNYVEKKITKLPFNRSTLPTTTTECTLCLSRII